MASIEIKAVFTRAGINRLLTMKGQGLTESLSHIALGDVAFTPNEDMTTLTGERERFAITDSQEGDLLARLGVRVTTTQEYPVRAVAGILSDGTLLFVYSSPDPNFLITYLTEHVSGLDVRFLLRLHSLPSNALTISVSNPGSMIYTAQFATFARSQIAGMTRYLKQLLA